MGLRRPTSAGLSYIDRRWGQIVPGQSIILIAAVNTAPTVSSWKPLELGRYWLGLAAVLNCFWQFLGLRGVSSLELLAG